MQVNILLIDELPNKDCIKKDKPTMNILAGNDIYAIANK